MNIAILSQNPQLYSTKRLVEEGRKAGHQVTILDPTKCAVVMEQGDPAVMYKGKPILGMDVVIPRIGASVTFFGTAVLRQFELMKTATTSKSQGVIRSRDKLRSLQILSRSKLGIPKTVFAKHPKNYEVERMIKAVGGVPVVIKLIEGTQGLGVVLADSENSAKSVVEAFSGLEANILVQEYIGESKGVDIRVLVVDGKVVGAMERTGKPGEFRSNLHRGGKGRIIKLTKEERAAAIKATSLMGLGVAGVDLLRSKRGPLIVEVNSSPGLRGIEGSTGVNVAGKIIDFAARQVAAKQKTKRHKFDV